MFPNSFFHENIHITPYRYFLRNVKKDHIRTNKTI